MGFFGELFHKSASKGPSAYRSDPKACESTLEAALATIDGLREDRDRWVGRAAEQSAAIRGLNDRAFGLLAEVERLEAEVERLKAASCEDGCRVQKAIEEFTSLPGVESWSGLVEGK